MVGFTHSYKRVHRGSEGTFFSLDDQRVWGSPELGSSGSLARTSASKRSGIARLRPGRQARIALEAGAGGQLVDATRRSGSSGAPAGKKTQVLVSAADACLVRCSPGIRCTSRRPLHQLPHGRCRRLAPPTRKGTPGSEAAVHLGEMECQVGEMLDDVVRVEGVDGRVAERERVPQVAPDVAFPVKMFASTLTQPGR